ncbi:LacI family transcriptional regulator [Clostridiaceae bacterium]|nr:LacI family transcriptional regulator [Clostridiaceae bacterium]RKI17537.1 LacI family transcriptional regulator [bacterium 1XD21-70]
MVGIRDVAKYAGVSPSTVSRALSGAAYVEPEKKEKIMRAVSELNYKPNLAARSLKRGGSRLIGLIIPDIMNPYYPEVVKYMEVCAMEAGYSLILCDALGDARKEEEYFATLKYLFVDGILYIASTENIEHVKPYIGDIPMIIVNRTFDVDAPCINIDNADASYQAVKYLAENGHRKIALYINDKDRQYNRERLAGCLRVFDEYKIQDYEQYMVKDVESEDDAYIKTLQLMKAEDRPTAIFMFNDFMAFGVYRGITKSGLRIPDDISVVGFDDIPSVKYLDPPLTTLRHSLADTSGVIFEKLAEQMRTQTCAPASRTYFKGRLIVRESVREIGRPGEG